MGVAAFKRVGDHVPAAFAGEYFNEQAFGAREFGSFQLQFQPFAHLFGVEVPEIGVVQHGAHTGGKVGGEGQAGAGIGGDGGDAGAAIGAFQCGFADAQET